LAKQSEYSAHDQLNTPAEMNTTSETSGGKKPFIEPEISPAVDVLEATTFLQFTDSGATN
jgi:hypothetical protein